MKKLQARLLIGLNALSYLQYFLTTDSWVRCSLEKNLPYPKSFLPEQMAEGNLGSS